MDLPKSFYVFYLIINQEFKDSCKTVIKDRDIFYNQLCAIPDMKVFKPDANYIFCRLPDDALSGTEVTKRLFIEYNIYIKIATEKRNQKRIVTLELLVVHKKKILN